jgi:hypothetical protein
MTGHPIITPTFMCPMTGDPTPTWMGRLGPMTTNGYISAATGFPLLIDPDVSRTGSNRTNNRMPYRPYRYIDLRGS